MDDLGGITATRLLMRKLFEEQEKFLTLDVGPFGEGSDSDNVQIGPNMGFNDTTLVLSFNAGSNQHAFEPDDAPAVRQIIEAMQGWLDWVESGCVRTTEEKQHG
jgi:hypothetical protein